MWKDDILRAWGSIDWVRQEGGHIVFGPDPRQILRVFWDHGLNAIDLGIVGRDADGNTFLLHNAATALEAELLRHVMNDLLDTMGFEEPKAVANG